MGKGPVLPEDSCMDGSGLGEHFTPLSTDILGRQRVIGFHPTLALKGLDQSLRGRKEVTLTSCSAQVARSWHEAPGIGRLKQANHLRSGVRDQPGQHGKTVSTKNSTISQA
ncbi:hypothetical protein AAY473_002038 [Plecturocebus cupreus]